MIPFGFEYYQPSDLAEAVELYTALEAEQKKPLYYSGGTEIITFGRQGKLLFGALIDLKKIEQTRLLKIEQGRLMVGACASLSNLTDQQLYPLIAQVARGVADRTVRNRLTLGGNICSRLPYREAVLPFLLADAEVFIFGPKGSRSEPLQALFDKRLRLAPGELLVQLSLPESKTRLKTWCKRRVKHGPVDYPLLHTTAVLSEGCLLVAVSGLCAFPFRSAEVEKALNDNSLSVHDKVDKAIALLPAAIRSDDLASAEYRETLWRQDLAEMFQEMEGAQ
jgi:CO/xanthine dehydrogenase FAD-binding subunit